MKSLAQYLRNLARMLNQAADKLDPPKVDINGNPVTSDGGGGPGEEGK